MAESYRDIETPQTAVENLAFSLGMMMVSCNLTESQVACFVESVVVLGKAAGLKREDFSPFDVTHVIADQAWAKYP